MSINERPKEVHSRSELYALAVWTKVNTYTREGVKKGCRLKLRYEERELTALSSIEVKRGTQTHSAELALSELSRLVEAFSLGLGSSVFAAMALLLLLALIYNLVSICLSIYVLALNVTVT